MYFVILLYSSQQLTIQHLIKNEMTLLSTRMQKSHAYVSLLILDRI